MDNSELALLATSFLAENLSKGVLSAIGKDVWTCISEVFSSDSEKKSLELLVSKPSDSLTQGKVIGKLEEALEANPTLSEQLRNLLNNVSKPSKSNVQNITGSGNVTFQDISNSNINAHGK